MTRLTGAPPVIDGWAQQRYGGDDELDTSAWSALAALRRRRPANQLMMKLTYWFSS